MAAACSVQRLCAVSQSSCDGSSLVALAVCMPLVVKVGLKQPAAPILSLAASLCPRFNNASQPRLQRSSLAVHRR